MRSLHLHIRSEFIMFCTKPQLLKSPGFQDIELDGDQIQAVSVVRNLGFHMDVHLKNDKHINNVTSKCIFLIKKISVVRKTLGYGYSSYHHASTCHFKIRLL